MLFQFQYVYKKKCLCENHNIFSAILLILPGLTLSATEILLEPSGGKAILVESDLVVKRNTNTVNNVVEEQPETKVVMNFLT